MYDPTFASIFVITIKATLYTKSRSIDLVDGYACYCNVVIEGGDLIDPLNGISEMTIHLRI